MIRKSISHAAHISTYPRKTNNSHQVQNRSKNRSILSATIFNSAIFISFFVGKLICEQRTSSVFRWRLPDFSWLLSCNGLRKKVLSVVNCMYWLIQIFFFSILLKLEVAQEVVFRFSLFSVFHYQKVPARKENTIYIFLTWGNV
jgi:hypothetical protein